MPTRIVVTKAGKTTDAIEDLEILVTGEPPESKAFEVFDNDAHVLAVALQGALPGGTFDRLLALMLYRTASRLVVPYKDVSTERR